jgi:hypothetical protein
MRVALRRTLSGIAAIAAVLVLGTGQAPGTVGQRIANGDGDTAGKCLATGSFGAWMDRCDHGTDQNWRYVEVGGNVWEIRSLLPGPNVRCLSGFNGHGFQVDVDNCNGSNVQRWIRITYTSTWHGWVNLQYSSQCLDVAAHGTSSVVQLWDCISGQGNQKWKMY